MALRMMRMGLDLTVWARRPEAAAEFAEKGARVAASVEELGAACDHVGLCVVNDADVLDVAARLVPAMRRGSLLAVHSTILPETVAGYPEFSPQEVKKEPNPFTDPDWRMLAYAWSGFALRILIFFASRSLRPNGVESRLV